MVKWLDVDYLIENFTDFIMVQRYRKEEFIKLIKEG